MRHYGDEPPWSGKYGDFGWWKRGEEMWDGSGYEWIWQPPVSGTFWKVSGILADHYLPVIQRELNRELSLLTLLSTESVEPKLAA